MILNSLNCDDDAGISDVKKEIATLESALQKLSEQEEKYSTELDEALKQYAELKEQVATMDAAAVDRVKAAYGEKYDPLIMHDSKRDVAELLGEETMVRSIREHLQKKREHRVEHKKTSKKHEQER